jgi:hypothetical protein
MTGQFYLVYPAGEADPARAADLVIFYFLHYKLGSEEI